MRLLNALRTRLQKRPDTIGQGCIIDPTAVFHTPAGISLGDYVRIGPQCILHGEGELRVGEGTILGPRVIILTSTHQYQQENYLPYHAVNDYRPVKIGRGVWIGWGALLVPGISIDDGAVVASGAVVTKDVEKGQVVGGNPAKEINRRPTELVDRLVSEKKYYLEAKLKNQL